MSICTHTGIRGMYFQMNSARSFVTKLQNRKLIHPEKKRREIFCLCIRRFKVPLHQNQETYFLSFSWKVCLQSSLQPATIFWFQWLHRSCDVSGKKWLLHLRDILGKDTETFFFRQQSEFCVFSFLVCCIKDKNCSMHFWSLNVSRGGMSPEVEAPCMTLEKGIGVRCIFAK